MAKKMDYSQKLKDPRWQKKRLEILQRDDWACQKCFDTESPLHVHHKRYIPVHNPWEYPNNLLVTLCELCHENEMEYMKESIASLIEQSQEYFFAHDIDVLASGINQLNKQFSPNDVSSTLEWILSNEPVMNEMINRFYESNKKGK